VIREDGLFGVIDKVAESVQFLKDHEPPEGYYLAFSGGKDSICIKELARMAGVKYDAHYSVTTIDPPELVRFIKQHHKDVTFDHPERPLLKQLVIQGAPLRQARWCCALYKENGGAGRRVITGIRAAESAKRAGRRAIEPCYKDSGKIFINPIINWSDDDVWEFIKERELPYCSLYDEGWKRIGCLFCPNAGSKERLKQAKRYPRMTKAFIKHFELLWADRKSKPKKDGSTSVDRWASGEEFFWWWLGVEGNEETDQTVLFE